jgi:hypothetical protein
MKVTFGKIHPNLLDEGFLESYTITCPESLDRTNLYPTHRDASATQFAIKNDTVVLAEEITLLETQNDIHIDA